jgi:extradiol dioxygenase family protein
VRRGFCANCGSSLFWDPLDQQKHNWTAIALGAFDTPTNTKLKQHIFVGEKGDYYDIADGLPQIRDPRKPDEKLQQHLAEPMNTPFHLSIGVSSIGDSVNFFTEVLNGKVTHNEPAYVNLELFGHQITLKPNETISPDRPDFHFGFNMTLMEFDRTAETVTTKFAKFVHMKPKVVDSGTSMERKKMYLKSPTGYLVELKGYQ